MKSQLTERDDAEQTITQTSDQSPDEVYERSAQLDDATRELLERPVTSPLDPTGRQMVASMLPDNAVGWREYCEWICGSDIVPQHFRGKPENCWIAIEYGLRLGLGPAQSLQNIAVINGRPSLYGPIGLAIVRSHPDFAGMTVDWTPDELPEDATRGVFQALNLTCHVTIWRRVGDDAEPTMRSFSVSDAVIADLWGKSGPWQNYPKRMLQHRATWWAMSDGFGDVIGGLPSAEEQADLAPAVVAHGQQLVPAAARSSTLAEKLARKAAETRKPEPTPSAPENGERRHAQPAQRDAPISFTDLIESIRTASSQDALDEARALINDWPDLAEKKQAMSAYRNRVKGSAEAP